MEEQGRTSVTVAESTATDDTLKALDCVVQRSRRGDIRPRELKDIALRSLLDAAGRAIHDDEDAAKIALDALDTHEELGQRKIIATCILRLLPEPAMNWLSRNPWRAKVVRLLDSQFAEDLYRDRRIDVKSLAHEKIDQLAEVVREHERDLLGALDMLTSLDRMRAHRQRLMSVINSRVGRVLTRPFLPGNIEAELGELYKRVEIYLDGRDHLGVIDAYARAFEEAERVAQALETMGTLYSHWLAERVARKVLKLVEEDFASNKAAQPGTVSVEARDKKYPFHLVGQTVNLGFTVQNPGPGYAYDTRVVVAAAASIKPATHEIELGTLPPGSIRAIEVPSEVRESRQQVNVLAEARWSDFDRTERTCDFAFVAEAQRSDIDWEQLAQSDPYSLEPVTNERDLVGRKDVLDRLVATAQAPNVGSSIIQGQKRVGKTSLARALESHLERDGYLVVYLDNYVEPSARATVARVGTKICGAISGLDQRLSHLDIPAFYESLSPLYDFLESVGDLVPDRQVVIILDEFDELPLDLYVGGLLGDAFFLALRGISSRAKVGFVVVGGEKMAHIMDCQGVQLNKWISVPVDYFSRESDWIDYRELVQRPVADSLEYAEEALNALHDATAGNPYFTKLVCQYVLQTAVKRRDCYITKTEIEQAVGAALRDTDRNAFQHFWDDGIFLTGSEARAKSVRRRKTLFAVSDVLAEQAPAPALKIREHKLVRDIGTVDTDLREFVTRKVLVGCPGDTYDFKVQLFHEWLAERGVHDVIATSSDLDAALRERLREEELKIGAGEILGLVEPWPTYKGQALTTDKIRAWLDQFGNVRNQRLMFAILKALRFYSNDFVRKKMDEVTGIVTRGLTKHMEPDKRKLSHILVSYLDSPAKSGAHFARLYADQARIYVGNVVEKGKLAETLKERTDIQALVFVDDFVGTGQSASEYLQELDATLAPIVGERGEKIVNVVFVAVLAFIEGWKRVEETVDKLEMPVHPYACEILDETARCFGEKSGVFPDPSERERAMEIALAHGNILEKKCPLGYGGLELAVVFERGCPNNSLPILWKESRNPPWVPLFKRS